MSIINSQPRIGAAGQSTGFKIERSLRFNSADSAYLNRTPASAGNRRTWTWSGWVKRSALGTTHQLFTVETVNGGTYTDIKFGTDNKLYLDSYGTTGALQARCVTDGVFRDVSAWYHVLAVLNTPNATAGDRAIIYVNGVRVSQTITDGFDLDAELMINTTNEHRIGADVLGNEGYFSGYLTEVYFIDGSAKTPSDFGETDTNTGVWKPKAYSGSYGTNGFYLKFADNSGTTSTTLGKDSSGNGNNWTPNNFSVTAGAGNDSLVDTPTPYGTDTGAGGEVRGNYCTWNPLSNLSGQMTLTNGNLDAAGQTNATWQSCFGTLAMPTSGKWFFEITINTSAQTMVGITRSDAPASASNDYTGNTIYGYEYYSFNGNKYNSGSNSSYGASYTTGDVIGVAFDADNGTLVFYKNGVSQGTAYTGLTGYSYYPTMSSLLLSSPHVANFGQRPFAYTAPSGFKALCTQNLPTPTIGATSATQAGKYFNPVLWTGNGSNRSITGVGFQPDWVWIKHRSNSYGHRLADAVRGAGKELISNGTDQELTNNATGYLSSFDSDGFSLTGGAGVNENNSTYVGWCWRGNGAGSSNTSGTISSTVSVNTTAGFSIVTYTGNGSNSTVGHGLGVAPSMIIVKRRDGGSDQWTVWQKNIFDSNSANVLFLNTTGAVTAASTNFNSTAPTSTVFSVGTASNTNANTGTYVAYCFAAVAGYSAFGSYTGNGSSDGTFVYTGFRPAFVLVKGYTGTNAGSVNWWIFDGKRPGYNVTSNRLAPNVSDAEASNASIVDFTSNGFKWRDSSGGWNDSAISYVYAAFAEVPTKFSLAR